MRSYVLYPSAHGDRQEKPQKKKLSSINNGGNSSIIDAAAGYGLRENPKKTCRFEYLSGAGMLDDKICKECGRGFQSWKALFGHMKSHSVKIIHTRLAEQDSWTNADQSDNETTPSRKKRTSRETRRYDNNMVTAATTTSSSLSFNANASSSASGVDQEQEEVAMCLIMLSKDVSHRSGLNSIGEFSGNNSELLETKNSVSIKGELVSFQTICKGKLKSELQVDALLLNTKTERSAVAEVSDFQNSKIETVKILIKKSEHDKKVESGTKKKHNSRKRSSFELFDSNSGTNNSELYSENFEKKSKFDCASCKKTFHSYQALGGHRASHKKYRGSCYDPKVNDSENNSVTVNNLSQDQTADNDGPLDQEILAGTSNGRKKMINKGVLHKCSICFRIFSSGQALGGHKRAHLIADAKNNQSTSTITAIDQKPVLEIRDFLDLNLPAPDEEDDVSEFEFCPWWTQSNQKQEPLQSFLSN